ncbi:MAG: hypothetical protein K0R31_389, partial [Clostridiales bacterium]|nr:hypothetical protein [Clostridiales bacterium]
MNEEEKKSDENNEVDNNEFLPIPELEEETTEFIDPDFVPAPEEADEYLPDITPEMVREEVMGLD